MENPNHKWRLRSLGKSSIFMGHLYHGYVSHNQRGNYILGYDGMIKKRNSNSQIFHLSGNVQ